MKVETSTPTDVGRPIGPYSHVAKAGPFIAISGTAGVDPVTGELAGPEVVAQTREVLRSLERMLASAGSDLGHVLHVNVFLKRIEDFDAMNGAYREAFGDLPLPARTVVAVADLPRAGALLTMNLTAVVAEPGDTPPSERTRIP